LNTSLQVETGSFWIESDRCTLMATNKTTRHSLRGVHRGLAPSDGGSRGCPPDSPKTPLGRVGGKNNAHVPATTPTLPTRTGRLFDTRPSAPIVAANTPVPKQVGREPHLYRPECRAGQIRVLRANHLLRHHKLAEWQEKRPATTNQLLPSRLMDGRPWQCQHRDG
jgi:hypothetical protein